MDVGPVLSATLRSVLPWYILWLVDHTVVFFVLLAISAMVAVRFLASYASMMYRVLGLGITVGFIVAHVGAMSTAWFALGKDAGVVQVVGTLIKAATLPTRLSIQVILSPFSSIISTARTVAGIVASPMLKIIHVQWHLLLGVAHALLRETILGFSMTVVLLYYHCKSSRAAPLVLAVCAEIENGGCTRIFAINYLVTSKKSSSIQYSSPKSRINSSGAAIKGNQKPNVQKMSAESKGQPRPHLSSGNKRTTTNTAILPKTFISLIPKILPGFVLTLIRIVTSFIRIISTPLSSPPSPTHHRLSLLSFKGSSASYPIESCHCHNTCPCSASYSGFCHTWTCTKVFGFGAFCCRCGS